MRRILVGCGAAKLPYAAPVEELYCGSLARAAILHAQASGLPWAILSARHGIVTPGEVIAPYDHRLPSARQLLARLQLAQRAYFRMAELRWLGGELELHMGDDYAQIVRHMNATGTWLLAEPLQGLQVGQRLAWYAQHRR